MVEKKNDGRKDSEFGNGGMSEKEIEESRRKGGEHNRSDRRPK